VLIARFSPRPAPPPGCKLPLCLPHTHSLSNSLPGRCQLPRRRQIRAQSHGLGVDGGNERRRHDLQDFCLPRRPCPRQDRQHPDGGQLRAVPGDWTACIQYRRRQVDSWQGFHGTRRFLQALPSALRYVMHVRVSPVAHTILQLCPLTHARTQHAKHDDDAHNYTQWQEAQNAVEALRWLQARAIGRWRSWKWGSPRTAPAANWRTDRKCSKLYRCEPGMCNGSNTCNRGRIGVACGRCPENHALEAGVCVECNVTRDPAELIKWQAVFGVVVGLIALVLWFLFAWAPLFGGTALSFFMAWFAWCVLYVVICVSHDVFQKRLCAPCLNEIFNFCPVCVSRPIQIFNRSKHVYETAEKTAEQAERLKVVAKELAEKAEKVAQGNLKLFQQYLKASAHLRVYLRSSSLTLFLKSLSCCLRSVHVCKNEQNTFCPFCDRLFLLRHAPLKCVFAPHPIPTTSR
jgi:hypothetical protein